MKTVFQVVVEAGVSLAEAHVMLSQGAITINGQPAINMYFAPPPIVRGGWWIALGKRQRRFVRAE